MRDSQFVKDKDKAGWIVPEIGTMLSHHLSSALLF